MFRQNDSYGIVTNRRMHKGPLLLEQRWALSLLSGYSE